MSPLACLPLRSEGGLGTPTAPPALRLGKDESAEASRDRTSSFRSCLLLSVYLLGQESYLRRKEAIIFSIFCPTHNSVEKKNVTFPVKINYNKGNASTVNKILSLRMHKY